MLLIRMCAAGVRGRRYRGLAVRLGLRGRVLEQKPPEREEPAELGVLRKRRRQARQALRRERARERGGELRERGPEARKLGGERDTRSRRERRAVVHRAVPARKRNLRLAEVLECGADPLRRDALRLERAPEHRRDLLRERERVFRVCFHVLGVRTRGADGRGPFRDLRGADLPKCAVKCECVQEKHVRRAWRRRRFASACARGRRASAHCPRAPDRALREDERVEDERMRELALRNQLRILCCDLRGELDDRRLRTAHACRQRARAA
jgi:hypothetical protein